MFTPIHSFIVMVITSSSLSNFNGIMITTTSYIYYYKFIYHSGFRLIITLHSIILVKYICLELKYLLMIFLVVIFDYFKFLFAVWNISHFL